MRSADFTDQNGDDADVEIPHAVSTAGATSDARALFNGDKGTLTLELRRVLIQLLNGPFLDGRKSPKSWATLVLGQNEIEAALNNLGLDLIMDAAQEVAFTRQVDDESLTLPVLLRKHKLGFIDSVLLLYLRERIMLATAEGSRAVVSRQDLLDHLLPFDNELGDEVKFLKKRKASIEKMLGMQILNPLKSVDERYEISPALKMILPAEEVQALALAYKKVLSSQDDTDELGDSDVIHVIQEQE